MADFKVGEIVQLKSGGPKMTVVNVNQAAGKVWIATAWFAGSKAEDGNFPADSLKYPDEQEK